MSFRFLHLPKSSADPVLIFVHGILSGAHGCWLADNGTWWPDLVKHDPAFAHCGVATFEYVSAVTGTRVSISDAAGSLWEALDSEGLLAPGRLLIFVCHSMGGIVVRKMLVKEQFKIVNAGIHLVGLFLVASPTMGSWWAALLLPLSRLFRSKQAIALSSDESNEWLRDLRHEFVQLYHQGPYSLLGKELVEDVPIKFKRLPWIPAVVQPDEGAVLFPDARKIGGSNHYSIAKPENVKADQQVALRNFLRDFQLRASQSNCMIPAGLKFAQAAQLLGRSLGLTVDVSQFSQVERDVTAANPYVITGSNSDQALEKLLAAFPANSIRRYRVTTQNAIATLGPLP